MWSAPHGRRDRRTRGRSRGLPSLPVMNSSVDRPAPEPPDTKAPGLMTPRAGRKQVTDRVPTLSPSTGTPSPIGTSMSNSTSRASATVRRWQRWRGAGSAPRHPGLLSCRPLGGAVVTGRQRGAARTPRAAVPPGPRGAPHPCRGVGLHGGPPRRHRPRAPRAQRARPGRAGHSPFGAKASPRTGVVVVAGTVWRHGQGPSRVKAEHVAAPGSDDLRRLAGAGPDELHVGTGFVNKVGPHQGQWTGGSSMRGPGT
ncbi:hypothetical protein Spla01_02440 [Streptomyces platensis]|uniref:Uncharacterized protein n=1 Tax=Streptomyces platensis TaxID=58346 RepID=A0ABX3XS19_STRPT|nr:hypothetical protein BG653_05051 [Streptomyces platensis]